MTDYDFIGDVHGHAAKLEELLLKLGYQRWGKGFRHPSRKAFFVGDYIDRGPDNPRAVEIVRAMVDADDAVALCGNHEHNAICFNVQTANGYLRPHTVNNFKQHAATLLQFHGKQQLYDDAIAWFKTLPLYHEAPTFNAVHATYERAAIDYLKTHTADGVLRDADYAGLADKDSPLFDAIETVCKGKEIELPGGQYFFDKDGQQRFHTRIKWWLDPSVSTVKALSMLEDLDLPTEKVGDQQWQFYDEAQRPVFFGHYWLRGEPNLYRDNICCLDYSVAKGGYLTAYRFSGESQLDVRNLFYV